MLSRTRIILGCLFVLTIIGLSILVHNWLSADLRKFMRQNAIIMLENEVVDRVNFNNAFVRTNREGILPLPTTYAQVPSRDGWQSVQSAILDPTARAARITVLVPLLISLGSLVIVLVILWMACEYEIWCLKHIADKSNATQA